MIESIDNHDKQRVTGWTQDCPEGIFGKAALVTRARKRSRRKLEWRWSSKMISKEKEHTNRRAVGT